jgi:hypothetical protein
MINYLIDFKNSVDDETIQTYFLNNQCTLIKQYLKFEKVYLVSSDTTPPLTDIIESIQEDHVLIPISPLGDITFVTYNALDQIDINVESEKDWWKIYSIKNIDISNSIEKFPILGEGVNVYIMDSGINHQHEEFDGRNISFIYSITDDYSDETGHGTAITSVIAGKTCSLNNPNIKIVKLWGSTQQAFQSQILSALDAVLFDSLNSTDVPSVVNISWGIAKNSYIESKIQVLLDVGIIVVASAGNTGAPINDITPASIPGVITVGSYNQDFIPSNFSSYTDPSIVNLEKNSTNHGELDVWAPGEKIWAAQAAGGYGFAAGTSFSSAIYTGEVISVFSQSLIRFKNEGNSKIYKILKDFDRDGLLDLSDSKYASSTNKICTYFKNYDLTAFSSNSRNETLIVRVGETFVKNFYIPALTISYEIIGTIPEGLTIEAEYLIYSPKENTQDSTKIEKHTFQVKLQNNNNTEIIKTIELVKINSDYDLPTITMDDKIISIVPASGDPTGAPCGNNLYAPNLECNFQGAFVNCRSYDCQTFYTNKGEAYCGCGYNY